MNPTYRRRSLLTALLSMALLSTPVLAADAPPSWLYPVPPKDYKPELADSAVVKLPGSKASYTAGQLRDNFVTGDWYPEEHPTMPDVVKNGRKPSVFACAHCHRTSGQGGPENATIAGMPHDYIVRQLKDYRSGARSTAVAGRSAHDWIVEFDEAAQARFERLKNWRTAQSKAQGRPPYVIFHDSTLAEMASRHPTSSQELATISGVGAHKLEAYGADLLALM